MKSEVIIYTSPPSWRSLGGRYTIYADRVVLHCRILFWKFVIPLDEIKDVGIFPWLVLRSNPTAAKLDLADLYPHVCIAREGHWINKFAFVPDDNDAFVKALRAATAAYKAKTGSTQLSHKYDR